MKKIDPRDLWLLAFLIFPALGHFYTLHWEDVKPFPSSNALEEGINIFIFNYWSRLIMGIICTFISGACVGILLIQFKNRKLPKFNETKDADI